jgi:hypothetical protein
MGRIFIGLGICSVSIGVLQIVVGGAHAQVLAPGLTTLVLYLLPRWIRACSQTVAPSLNSGV